ncbi:ASCH domain-containing protein [Planctomicrobium sp. SH668]|uniref:ASCH domain-containing protein n=1 Tax=Planctomicrobium sp. SH668 TaxID=3448126 RepID=UPI003F5B4490
MTVSAEEVDVDRIALSIQQPWAELILQGIKSIEIRRVCARPRGIVYLYTSKRLSSIPDLGVLRDRYGISPTMLPLGQIVGTVEILDCRRARMEDAAAAQVPSSLLTDAYSWMLGNPQRLPQPLQPRYLPFGTWFYPFKRLQINTRQRR